MVNWLAPILGIVLIDLVLSGDNAVVIGAVAATVSPHQRLVAIVLGGSGAIVLRILFALAAIRLLQMPYLGVVGGIILLVIAIHLLINRATILSRSKHDTPPAGEQEQTHVPVDQPASKGLFVAVGTILLADVVMSLDNVLAIAGLARGNLLVLMAGLALSITILLMGSALVAMLIARLPWLLDLACLVIGWTAANVFLADDTLLPVFQHFPWVNVVAYVVVMVIVLVADAWLHKRARSLSEGDRKRLITARKASKRDQRKYYHRRVWDV
jgi:YjbE family integral membrane protein